MYFIHSHHHIDSINFWYSHLYKATENEYDLGENTESKAPVKDKNVVLVSSIDLCEPKNKNAILVQPELNPYYGERISEINGDVRAPDSSLDIEKITVVKNMYYAESVWNHIFYML